MQISGRWHPFDDGVVRPVLDVHIQTPDGNWESILFLLDSGADRTVIDASYLSLLAPLAVPDEQSPQLGGVGGQVDCVFIQTKLRLTKDDGKPIVVNGLFGIFTEAASSDVAILGRDVTNNFDVIYSYPQREVLLLAAPHTYSVQLPF